MSANLKQEPLTTAEVEVMNKIKAMRASKREFTPEEHAEFARKRQQKERDAFNAALAEYSEKIIAASGLSKVLATLTFESFKANCTWQQHMKVTAEAYAENPDGWLLFSGQSGSGKTHLCTAVAGKLLQRRVPVKYMRWRIDSAKLKPNYSDAEQADRELRRYINTPCLYIDDFLKGNITSADINIAFALIDGRYSRDCKTIISTELLPEELMKIDEAIAGRIFERCGKNRIKINTDSKKNYRMRD